MSKNVTLTEIYYSQFLLKQQLPLLLSCEMAKNTKIKFFIQ